ncbi:MAG: tyrosine-type recombinase/integrase [bacterium]
MKFNPLQGRKRLKLDSRGVVRYLSDDEEYRLLKALAKREGNIALIVPLLLNTGARPNEALSLTWNNVDLKARRITLKAAFTKIGLDTFQ